MDVLKTGPDSITIGIELALEGLTNGISEVIRCGFFSTPGHVDGPHVDSIRA